jgi:hypothetical protein
MRLRVLTGRSTGKTVAVTGERFVVGRRRDCHLVLRDDGVDDRHAAFLAAGAGRYVLEDLESASGTFVDGIRLLGRVELRGDEPLCFGETFAALEPGTIPSRRSRPTLALGVGAAVVLAASGVTAAVLVPHTGSGPALATVAAPRASPAAQPAPSSEPPVAALPAAPPAATVGETERAGAAPAAFRDDFSDAGSGWEVFDEAAVSAGYDDGRFVMRVDDATWYATADSGRAFERPVVSVVVSNPGRTTAAGFGVVCRYLGQRRFHALAVGADGTYAILRQRGETLTVLSGGGHWARSAFVPAGAERYRLRAECRDAVLRLSVNGREVASVRTRGEAGRVGLFVAGLGEFRFDDVVVVDRAPAAA